MVTIQSENQDSRLLSYVIASGDMRHIPVNERELYLRTTLDNKLFIRGEIPGCGSSCLINLSQVLFEYAVSCEDCKDHIISAESEERFGEHLGQVLAMELTSRLAGLPETERLEEAMAIILRSVDVRGSIERAVGSMRFVLDECPVHRAADEPGYTLRLPVVHLGFAAFCASTLAGVAPTWQMVSPLVEESDVPVQTIHFEKMKE